MRHLEALSEKDTQAWIDFGTARNLRIYLQPKGMNSIHLLTPNDADPLMKYSLTVNGASVELKFHPADFTQVNAEINQQMVQRAVDLLDCQAEDNILELFCGLGNFSLPIAQNVKTVVGVEGDDRMVQRATMNAANNQLDNCEFYAANLMEDVSTAPWMKQSYNKVFLDPPRSGAKEMLPLIASLAPERIVYVSCNPATLARDAGELVHEYGYTLNKVGVMDMFPHTAHVEAIALFTKT